MVRVVICLLVLSFVAAAVGVAIFDVALVRVCL